MEFETLFALMGGLFVAALVYTGFRTRKWIHDASDYLLAGREISTGLNVFGVASIGFAGTSITLVPAMAVLYGFWPSFFNQLIFCIGGLVFYGLFFTGFIRRCGAQTLPEWLEVRYNRNVRLVVTLGTILGLTGIMANNVVSIAVVLTGFIDLSFPLAVSIIFFIFLLFSFAGGFWAITFTDFIQLLLGLVAVPLILFSLFDSFGSFAWVSSRWAEGWVRGNAGTLSIFSPRFPSVLTSVFLFATFLVWGNNYYWLRSASCRSEKAARNSYIIAGLLLATVIYIPLLLVGLYTRAAFPDLLGAADFFTATTSYGLLLRTVPAFTASVLLLVPLAAGISTATTAHIGATSVAVRDLYQRCLKPDAHASDLLIPSRIILVFLGLMVWLLSFYPGGPMILFAFANAWLGPPALLIILGILWPRFTAAAAFWSTILSIAVMSLFTLLSLTGLYQIDSVMHVGMAGFITGTASALFITLISEPKYYGKRSWNREVEGGVRIEITPGEAELEVLAHIDRGYRTMAELADMTGRDSARISILVERLDQGGFIERQSLIGAGFYTFSLSPEGRRVLPETREREKALGGDGLTGESLDLLAVAAEGTGALYKLVTEKKCSSLKLSTMLARLIAQGYLEERGFWRRSMTLTMQGKEALSFYRKQE